MRTLDLVQSMWTREGMISFYSGMQAKLYQTVTNSAFMFLVYEKLLRLFLFLLNANQSVLAAVPDLPLAPPVPMFIETRTDVSEASTSD